MSKKLDAVEVAKHDSAESCWVVLYGKVTAFLPHHPGGARAILRLAGRDATGDYDAVHPPGTLEEYLPPEALLGEGVDRETPPEDGAGSDGPASPPLDSLLNLDEIEEAATRRLSREAWAYYFSASDDLHSKRLNGAAYRSILLRPRVFVDCSECDISTTIMGHRVSTPVYVAPAAMARLAHPTGEAGIASACASFGACQIISGNASMTPERIVAGAPPDQVFGWQLYVQVDASRSEAMLARVAALAPRIKFLVLTLDAPVPGKREDDERGQRAGGIGARLSAGTSPRLTWRRTLAWLARRTTLPLVLKGIQTHEDAHLASTYRPQVRGIVLSNHGGRAADTAPPAVHTLLEMRRYCPHVFDGLEVLVDGGVRRGTDVAKALALGARAVGVGRAALWGLGAGGVQGVERTLEILNDELRTAMRLLGVQRIEDLGPRHVNTRALDSQIYDGPAGLDGGPVGPWVPSRL